MFLATWYRSCTVGFLSLLPWENEEDDGASGRTTRDETFTTAKTFSDGVRNSLTEKQERESSNAVDSRSVDGVDTAVDSFYNFCW